MSTEQLTSINDLANFINGSQKAAFSVPDNKQAKYLLVQSVLVKFTYATQNKANKGVIGAYIQKITGYSRQQLTKLINQYKKTGRVIYQPRVTNGFENKYTKEDVLALAAIDELHSTLNGITTKKLCERAYMVYQDPKYKRLASISVSHLYNLRNSTQYKNKNGMPGYLRIDTVHQGDYDGVKGVYHINAVDEVTQFEVVCTVEKISEQYLQPILEYILNAFPFKILGFHSDNDSEYVNYRVAELLDKLLIGFTKSRPRQSGDNGLVESKNGSVIRKFFGYMHIPQKFANKINIFNTHLCPKLKRYFKNQ